MTHIGNIRVLIPLSFFAGVLVLFVPLLREFHVEFAIFGAILGCCWGVWAQSSPHMREIRNELALPFIGLTIFAMPSLFRVLILGCFSVDGLGYWLLYPYPGLLFSYSLTRFFRRIVSRPRLMASLCLLVIAVPLFLVAFYNLPQTYFHNHVWGGWPGPIYDQEVALHESVFFFRWITLNWALLLFLASLGIHGAFRTTVFTLLALSLALSYSRLAENRIISPESYLQQQLGGQYTSPANDLQLFYPKGKIADTLRDYYIQLAHFHAHEIRTMLHLDTNRMVRIYLYENAWQKNELTGAKHTNYVPVWHRNPQVHINLQDAERVMRHELVHALATEFGNRTLNASFSIGLVEGLAVALAPSLHRRTLPDYLVAASEFRPGTREINRLFSLTGFYTGRGPMNYAVSGSFVRFLLETQDLELFKKAYRTSRITTFDHLDEIVSDWHDYLNHLEITEAARSESQWVFSVPSIFETDCPRKISPLDRIQDQLQLALTSNDTLAIFSLADQLMHQSGYEERWVYQNLRLSLHYRRNPADIDTNPMELPRNPAVLLIAADVARLRNEQELATQFLALAREESKESEMSPAFQLRNQADSWNQLIIASYFPEQFSFSEEEVISPILERIAIRNAIQQQKTHALALWHETDRFHEQLLQQPDLALSLVQFYQQMGYLKEATLLLAQISDNELTPLQRHWYNERKRLQKFIK